MKSAVLQSTDGLKIAIRPNRGERSIAQFVLDNDTYQKYHQIKLDDVVFDVGAHIGVFTIKAGRRVGDSGKVISIEPANDNYALLVENISLNNLDRMCIPIQCAAGEKRGTSKLRIFRTSVSDSLYERSSDYAFLFSEEVNVRTIDEIVHELGVDRVDFLKINVEGSELNVLKGSPRILKEFHPNIAIDTHDFGPGLETIEEYLRGFGYHKMEPTLQINYFI